MLSGLPLAQPYTISSPFCTSCSIRLCACGDLPAALASTRCSSQPTGAAVHDQLSFLHQLHLETVRMWWSIWCCRMSKMQQACPSVQRSIVSISKACVDDNASDHGSNDVSQCQRLAA